MDMYTYIIYYMYEYTYLSIYVTYTIFWVSYQLLSESSMTRTRIPPSANLRFVSQQKCVPTRHKKNVTFSGYRPQKKQHDNGKSTV